MPVRLDPESIHSWLQQEVDWSDGISLQDVRLNRLWVGRHGRLSFELALGLMCDGLHSTQMLQGGSVPRACPAPIAEGAVAAARRAAGRLVREGSHQRRHLHARVSRHGLTGLRLVSSALGLWCCTPDRDRKLPVVRELMDDERAASVLTSTAAAEVLALQRDGVQVKCEIVAYRAARRCVLRVRSTDSPGADGVFVKVFRRAPAIEQIELSRRLASHLDGRSHGRVRTPAIVDFRPTERLVGGAHPTLLITAAVPGVTCPLGTKPNDISEAANALAILHDAGVVTAPRVHSPMDEFQTVGRWVPALRALREQRYTQLRELVTELSGFASAIHKAGPERSEGPGTTTLIHRDFFASQLLRGDGTLWVLDLDTLCVGHPELDVGTFIAHLYLDGLLSGVPPQEVTTLAESFIESYQRSGGRVSGSRLRFYLPCALARLGAIHLVRGVSAQVVERLWGLAGGFVSRRTPPFAALRTGLGELG